jgi:DNA adenine methylase
MSDSVRWMATSAARILPTPVRVPRIQPARELPAPAPFLKWVGGKGKLLGQLMPMLPPGVELMRHVEPFAGGGAMFFARAPRRALLLDVNRALIDTYTAVRDEVETVIEHLRPLAERHAEGTYYEIRRRYNERKDLPRAQRASMFVYLNKTCFNGLHRVNRKGEFNVPEGRYKNPRVLHEDALRSASVALRECEIESTGFEALVAKAKPGDFVYLDPPYEPISRTSNFTSYAEEGFTPRDQERLRDVFVELDRRGCKLMLSNSTAPLILDLYKKFRIDRVSAARAISCDTAKRGPIDEVVVRNY